MSSMFLYSVMVIWHGLSCCTCIRNQIIQVGRNLCSFYHGYVPRFLIINTVSGATTSGILSESWHEVLVESVSGRCKLTGLVLFVKFSEISGGKMIDSDCDASANAVVPGGDAGASVVLLTAVTIKFYWTYWIKQLHEISG